MKTSKFYFAVIALMCLSLMGFSQQTTKKMYEKYSSAKGFTVVTVNKDLFTLLAEISAESNDQSTKEMQEVIKDLEYINILMYDANKGDDPAFLDKFKEELNTIKLSEYSELMVVKDEEETVKFYAKKDGENINELLLLVYEPQEAGFISITGKINMKSIGKIARTMNVQGLDNLEKINQQEKK